VDDEALSLLRLGLVAVLNIALAVVLGAVVSGAFIGSEVSPSAARRRQSLSRSACAGLAVLVAVDILLIWLQAAEMSELPLHKAFGSVDAFLTKTHAGRASAAGLVVLLIGAGVSMAGWSRLVGLFTIGVCAIAFSASRSWTGHAGASGDVVPFAIDWLHLVATGVWAGVVVLAAFVVVPRAAPARADDQPVSAAYVDGLSTTATWALVIVLLTGAVSAWRGIGSGSVALSGSEWALILFIKLALVAVAVALGAYNRLAVMPRLIPRLRSGTSVADRSLTTFTAVLVVEAVVLVAVEVAAAALSTAAPPSAL
jgi:putative copper resistance protein D